MRGLRQRHWGIHTPCLVEQPQLTPIPPFLMKDFYEKQLQRDARKIEKIERLRERAEDRKDEKSLRAFEKEADKELFGKASDF